jgi:purine-binding chemotaxis protein CheW
LRKSALLVIFSLDEQKYALHHQVVERVLGAVEITELPQAPKVVLGVINMHGRIIPVLDIRRRFNRPPRALRLSDQFIVAATSRRVVAITADRVINVVEYSSEQLTPAGEVLDGAAYISAIAKGTEGLILIHDLDSFLSLDESSQLDIAMGQLD